MSGYKFLEKLTRADVAFEATGTNPSEMFSNAALALFDIQVDLTTVQKAIKKEIDLTAKTLEDLMFNFLDELIFLKDKDAIVFSTCVATVRESDGWSLHAEIWGDHIDHEKQKLKVDAKAVTMHKFSVRKDGDTYKAIVVIDI